MILYSDHRTVKSTTANGHSGVGAVCVHVPITSWCDSPVGWRPWSIMVSERTKLCYVWNYTTWEKRKLETLTNHIIYTYSTIINRPTTRCNIYKYRKYRLTLACIHYYENMYRKYNYTLIFVPYRRFVTCVYCV